MFKLLRFLRGRDLTFALLSIFFFFIQTICDISQPFLLAEMLKQGDGQYTFWVQEPNNPLGGIWGIVGIMLACIACSLITQGIGIVISARVGVRFGSKIRFHAFQKIQSLTFKEIDYFTAPSLITRLTNDILYFQNASIITIRMLMRSCFLIIGGIIATFIIGAQINIAWIGAIFFSFMVAVIIAIFLILKHAIPKFRRQQRDMDVVNSRMRENLLGVRVVKAFNMQNDQKNRFDGVNFKFAKDATSANRWSNSIVPVIYFFVQAAVIVIMMTMAIQISNGTAQSQLTIVLQIFQVANYVAIGFILAVNVLVISSYTKASIDRINEIFNAKPSIERVYSNIMITTSNVKFDNVSYRYYDTEESKNALNNISFEANPGEMIGIIGPTGSGKSTLINLITRTYDVTRGSVYISGKNVKEINYDSLRNSIGVSPQKSVILSGTIASNLRFGKEDATQQEMEEACDLACASEFINQKENRFESHVEQRGTNLSGGQKQRISIARALIKKPKILILDDSTSALDMITEAKVQNAIRKYQNTTIFLVGQRINAISKADKIIVLDNGNMVGYGNHNQLMQNCNLYRDIAISQGFGN